MVSAPSVPQNLLTETWFPATWEEFLKLANHPSHVQSRFYYNRGYARIEAMPIGSGHSQDNTILSQVVSLYAMVKNIRLKGFTNGSFRKAGLQECQPDLAFYTGEAFTFPPKTSAPVDVNAYGPPALVIEISASSLNEDLGQKRLLYERLGVQEYWVADVTAIQVTAFAVAEGGSIQIQESKVLAGLRISVVEEALRRSQTEDDGAINRWLLQTFTPMTTQPIGKLL
jgi:Uma2 family endonuclease